LIRRRPKDRGSRVEKSEERDTGDVRRIGWSLLGRIWFAFSTIVVTAAALNELGVCHRQGHDLQAYGEFFPYNPPDTLFGLFDAAMDVVDEDSAIAALEAKDSLSAVESDSLDTLIAVRYNIRERAREIYWPIEQFRRRWNIRSQWIFTLRNSGDNQVEQVKLVVPFNGYYTVRFPSDSTAAGSFKKIIGIGNLDPLSTASLTVLGDATLIDQHNFSYSTDLDEIRVTHKVGSTTVVFPAKTTGVLAWIHRNWSTFAFVGVFNLLVFSIVLLAMALTAATRRRAK
jgi:hypothetical protein